MVAASQLNGQLLDPPRHQTTVSLQAESIQKYDMSKEVLDQSLLTCLLETEK